MKALVVKLSSMISLWGSFLSNSLTRDMEFKANFISGLIVDFVYYGTHYFFFTIIFSYVDSLQEFSKHDVMVFLIVTFIADTIYMLFFSGNLFNLNRLIIRGDLDFVLLKPINSQFIVSFRYVKSHAIVSLLILIGLLSNLLIESPRFIPNINLITFLFSFIMGLSIWYAFDFSIGCLGFWFRNFSTGGWLSHEVMKFSMRPDSIYTGWLRKSLFTIVPMALITSVPTRILLYGPNPSYILGQFIVAMIFLSMTRLIWKKGVQRYESASS